MKKMALRIFSLILFILVFCSLLAPAVETEMRTMVDVKVTSELLVKRNYSVPAVALKWENSQEILYHVVEGKGWNTGDRVEEMPPTSYFVVWEEDYFDPTIRRLMMAQVYPGKKYYIIIAASRQPTPGDEVLIVENFSEREDTYIIYYPEGVLDPDGYPNSYTKIAQSDQAMTVKPMKAYEPYFEQKTANTLEKMGAEELRVYSKADIDRFYQMIPHIFRLLLVLVLGVFLWVYSCVISIKGGRPLLQWRNVAFGAGLLWSVPAILAKIDLPASLLPRDNIFDIAHYRNEFRQIFAALKSLDSDMFRGAQLQCARVCKYELGWVIVLMALLILVDWIWKRYLANPCSKIIKKA